MIGDVAAALAQCDFALVLLALAQLAFSGKTSVTLAFFDGGKL